MPFFGELLLLHADFLKIKGKNVLNMGIDSVVLLPFKGVFVRHLFLRN